MSEETNHIDGDKHAVPSNPLLASAIGLLRIARCPDCEGQGLLGFGDCEGLCGV